MMIGTINKLLDDDDDFFGKAFVIREFIKKEPVVKSFFFNGFNVKISVISTRFMGNKYVWNATPVTPATRNVAQSRLHFLRSGPIKRGDRVSDMQSMAAYQDIRSATRSAKSSCSVFSTKPAKILRLSMGMID